MNTIHNSNTDDAEKHILAISKKISDVAKIVISSNNDVIYSSFTDVNEKHNVSSKTFSEYASDYRVVTNYDNQN